MSEGAPQSVHRLAVDHSERHSPLLDAVRRTGWCDVQMGRLATGDYLVNGQVLVERKTIRDLAASLIDGRLFPQVARLAHSPYRSLFLVEGPAPSSAQGRPRVSESSLGIRLRPALSTSGPNQERSVDLSWLVHGATLSIAVHKSGHGMG
jgi:ERCC4-type nuclease